MQALNCYFVVPPYCIQETTNARNTSTPKQHTALDLSCHRKNRARQPRGSGCRPRTCGEKYLNFLHMRIEGNHDGDDDALTYIWWIVKYEYGTENDIMSLVIWVKNPQMMTEDDDNFRVVGLKMARWLQVVEAGKEEGRAMTDKWDGCQIRPAMMSSVMTLLMMINMRLIFLILMPFFLYFEDSIFVLQVFCCFELDYFL